MRTKILSVLAAAVFAAIVIILGGVGHNVANAQLLTLANCPDNSVCVWSERDFIGERFAYGPASVSAQPNSQGNLECRFPNSNGITTPLLPPVRRSIINNTPCPIYLFITPAISAPIINTALPNTQQGDSGEFRAITGISPGR